jgi:hypothetical protein
MRMQSDVMDSAGAFPDEAWVDQAWVDVVEVHHEIGTRDDEVPRVDRHIAEREPDVEIHLHPRWRYASIAVPVPDQSDEVPWLQEGADDLGCRTTEGYGVVVAESPTVGRPHKVAGQAEAVH